MSENTLNVTDQYAIEASTEAMLQGIEVDTQNRKAPVYRTNDPTQFRPKRNTMIEGEAKSNVRQQIKKDPEDWSNWKNDLLGVGVRTPIEVMPNPDVKNDGVKYLILSGERRWTGFAELVAEGHTETMKGDPLELPYQIVRPVDEEEAFEIMARENLHREQLTPIEQAQIVRVYADRGLSSKEIGKRLNQTEVWVNGLKALVDEKRTPPEVLEALKEKKINKETAINIARQVKGGPEAKLEALKDVLSNAASKGDQKRRLANHTGKGPGRPGKKQLMEVYEALVETEDGAVSGTLKKADVLKAMTVFAEWSLGVKADRTMKIMLKKVFDGQVETSDLFKRAAKKDEE